MRRKLEVYTLHDRTCYILRSVIQYIPRVMRFLSASISEAILLVIQLILHPHPCRTLVYIRRKKRRTNEHRRNVTDFQGMGEPFRTHIYILFKALVR